MDLVTICGAMVIGAGEHQDDPQSWPGVKKKKRRIDSEATPALTWPVEKEASLKKEAGRPEIGNQ